MLLTAEHTGLRVDSEAQTERVRAVSIDRLGPALGRVSPPAMVALDDALRLHLSL